MPSTALRQDAAPASGIPFYPGPGDTAEPQAGSPTGHTLRPAPPPKVRACHRRGATPTERTRTGVSALVRAPAPHVTILQARNRDSEGKRRFEIHAARSSLTISRDLCSVTSFWSCVGTYVHTRVLYTLRQTVLPHLNVYRVRQSSELYTKEHIPQCAKHGMLRAFSLRRIQ